MTSDIQSVTVLGATPEGLQLAAHFASCGLSVFLIDAPTEEGRDRSLRAKQALDSLRQADPSPLLHPDRIGLIDAGNWEDDLQKVRASEWIVDALPEDAAFKKSIYKKIEFARQPSSLISTLSPLHLASDLLEGLGKEFAHDFLVTSFRFPVRPSRMVEIAATPATREGAVELLADLCDKTLGKTPILVEDALGHITGRLMAMALQSSLIGALDLGLTVEEADAVSSKALGFTKGGLFASLDRPGVALWRQQAKVLQNRLPDEDLYIRAGREIPCLARLGSDGFYRSVQTESGRRRESFSLKEGAYTPLAPSDFVFTDSTGKGLRALCEREDKYGAFAWKLLSDVLLYATSIADQIAKGFAPIDKAMRLGCGFAMGPFELIDKLGAGWFAARLAGEGRRLTESLRAAAEAEGYYRQQKGERFELAPNGAYNLVQRPEGTLSLSEIKAQSAPVEHNASASLWDVGDRVLCLEFHSKMNAIDASIFEMINKTRLLIENEPDRWKGLVLHNEADHFSVGANLTVFRETIKKEDWAALDSFLRLGQRTYHELRLAKFPTVAAPTGLALGGGCEALLHSSAIQACIESYPGLVEVGVGLIPGWGGCTQSLVRAFEARARFGENFAPVNFVYENIMQARVSKSALGAKDLLFFRMKDGLTMNRDRLLFDAKRRVWDLAADYRPPEPARLPLPGPGGKAALMLTLESWKAAGKISPHEITIGEALAEVLTGGSFASAGPVSEAQIMDLEREAFVKLAQTPQTLARIENMLATGKALKN